MKVTIEKNELVIRIPADLDPKVLSKTGKTLSVASSHGNQKTGVMDKKGREIIIGLNAYVKPTE